MTDRVVVHVIKKGKNSRSFRIDIDDSSFDVVINEQRHAYVQGKKIGSINRLLEIPLGNKSGEIEAYFYDFHGLKIINLRVENEIIYTEKLLNEQALKIETISETILKTFLFLFVATPTVMLVNGAMNGLGMFFIGWLKLGDPIKAWITTISPVIVATIAFTMLLDFLFFGKVSRKSLVKKKTIAEIETEHQYRGATFGYRNHEWEEKFKKYYQEDDEIWLWSTFPAKPPKIHLITLPFSDGYVIVRNGKITRHSFLIGIGHY